MRNLIHRKIPQKTTNCLPLWSLVKPSRMQAHTTLFDTNLSAHWGDSDVASNKGDLLGSSNAISSSLIQRFRQDYCPGVAFTPMGPSRFSPLIPIRFSLNWGLQTIPFFPLGFCLLVFSNPQFTQNTFSILSGFPW